MEAGATQRRSPTIPAGSTPSEPQRETQDAVTTTLMTDKSSQTAAQHAADNPAVRKTETCARMRRVLMISHAFPPAGGVGVQRSAKFAKYLPDFGWCPIVWSAGRIRNLPYDPSLLADLPPDLTHYRVGSQGGAFRRPKLAERFATTALGDWWCYRVVPGIGWRVRRGIDCVTCRLFPDDRVLWALRSLRPLLRVVRADGVDVIYSTYSPASNHLLAGWLKRFTGLPWVSDYRDLWIDDYCYPPTGRFRRCADHRLQQNMLEQADAVVAVNQQQADILASHVPSQTDRFYVVPNGVDIEDFDRLDPGEVRERLHGPPDRFVLTFTGQFTSRRVGDALFDGLGYFARWVARQGGGFELRVVGVISHEMRKRFKAAGVPLATTGFLPHDQAIEHMVSADVLLLLTPVGHHASTLTTGKVYEYLASDRPILLIGSEDSVARQLITGFNAGIFAVPNRDEIVTALKQLFNEWKRNALPSTCHRAQLRPFTRKHLAGQLAKILNEVRMAN